MSYAPKGNIDFKENERQLVLSKLMEAVEYLFKKCLKGNIRDERKDKIRVQYFRTLAYSCSIYNQISRDKQSHKTTFSKEAQLKILEENGY